MQNYLLDTSQKNKIYVVNLYKVSKEIRDIIDSYQNKNKLSFIEETHTYFIKDTDGEIKDNFPSVSTVLKSFYEPFDHTKTKAFLSCGGDPVKEKELLDGWKALGNAATNKGSRVHFILEDKLISKYDSYKKVRMPIFECNEKQIYDGDQMVKAGEKFINKMHQRGAVLLDTEMVLGSVKLGYTGQPDKVWLIKNKKDKLGIVITDWKTNRPDKFERQFYTKKLLSPFQNYYATDLGKYYIQLSLYAKLLLEMLKGSKYEDLPYFLGVVVLLKQDGTYEEFKVPKDIFNKVMDLNIKDYIS
jgi:hypothetical protein